MKGDVEMKVKVVNSSELEIIGCMAYYRVFGECHKCPVFQQYFKLTEK